MQIEEKNDKAIVSLQSKRDVKIEGNKQNQKKMEMERKENMPTKHCFTRYEKEH